MTGVRSLAVGACMMLAAQTHAVPVVAAREAPPAPSPSPHALLAAQEARMAVVMDRLVEGNAARCPPPASPGTDAAAATPGLLLSDLRLVPPSGRIAARAAYGIAADAPDGIHVAALLPDGAAAKAGVRVGDVLVDDGNLDAVEARLFAPSAEKAVVLRFHRPDAPALTLRPDGCVPMLRLEATGRRIAASTGGRIHISSGMLALARDGDQLAFLLAHEWAHGLLGHPLSGSAGWSASLRAREAAADAEAVAIVDAAGFDARGARALFAALARATGPAIGWSHGSPSARWRAVRDRIAALCAGAGALSPPRPSCIAKAAP